MQSLDNAYFQIKKAQKEKLYLSSDHFINLAYALGFEGEELSESIFENTDESIVSFSRQQIQKTPDGIKDVMQYLFDQDKELKHVFLSLESF